MVSFVRGYGLFTASAPFLQCYISHVAGSSEYMILLFKCIICMSPLNFFCYYNFAYRMFDQMRIFDLSVCGLATYP